MNVFAPLTSVRLLAVERWRCASNFKFTDKFSGQNKIIRVLMALLRAPMSSVAWCIAILKRSKGDLILYSRPQPGPVVWFSCTMKKRLITGAQVKIKCKLLGVALFLSLICVTFCSLCVTYISSCMLLLYLIHNVTTLCVCMVQTTGRPVGGATLYKV